jgi:hypothetical protein
MTLMESLAWAVVELESARPDMVAVRKVLDMAVMAAATLDTKHQVGQKNLFRMAQVCGVDDDLTGGTKWKI